MAENSRVHLIVSGRVQGVFFRDFTRQTAENLHVSGWVKNIHDNRVEIIAEGKKFQILEFIEQIKIGPEYAKVKDYSVSWDNYKGEFVNFRIVY